MNKFYLIVLTFIFSSCFPKGQTDNKSIIRAEMNKLMDADMAFSAMSEAKGMKAAFLEYMDSNGVLLRPQSLPIIGADAVDYLSQQDDKDITLTWKPRFASVSNSLDMGYTFGIYSLKPKNKDTALHGTYLSIWKKQGDGKWKFVLDTGNEGLGE
jgi:ketosteroid isomerase-like protein